MATESDRSKRAITLIMERGVISKDKSLADLIRISEELAAIPGGGGDPGELGAWEFIGPNYIWRGSDLALAEQIKTNTKR